MDSFKDKFYKGLQQKTLLENDSNWWIPCYWYPLKAIKNDISVVAFDARDFDDENKLKILKNIFESRGINRAIIIPEFEREHIEENFQDMIVEQDEDGYVFPYFSEKFIYDDSKEWMIYISHEHIITFAGKWLTEEIHKKINKMGLKSYDDSYI